MTFSMQTLLDAVASPAFWNICATFAALTVAGCGCGRCGGDSADDSDDEDGDEDGDFGADFNLSADDLREYDEYVEQENARIAELWETLEDYSGDDAQELENELVQALLARAVRRQEEGEVEASGDDYAAAFERIANYGAQYGESIELLRTLAAARLNYAILLNDEGELSDADAEYRKAAETIGKLVELGDRDAKLDAVGVELNRAAILFETGRQAESFETLDDAAEAFQKLADEEPIKRDEALFYLAKTLSTKADFVRSTLDEENDDATEANDLTRRAAEIYRRLVAGGHTEYKRDLADALVAGVATDPTRSKEDLERAIAELAEAGRLYEAVVACGENDACVDLFETSTRRAELLERADRSKEAVELCDSILETFEDFKNSDELPLLEGLAETFQRRARLRKEAAGYTKKVVADLTGALELQLRVADSLIETLRDDDGDSDGAEHSCGCGSCGGHKGHSCGGDGCGCGGHKEHSCGCGHCGGEDARGAEHSCGCGSCGGSCDGAERKFFVERWANENYDAILTLFFDRACAYLELRETTLALGDCLAADDLDRAYRAALREGETLTSDACSKLRELKASLRN